MNSFLKTILVSIAVVLVGTMVFHVYEPRVAEAGWYDTGGTWSYRKVITINNGKVEGSSNLTNFPILVDITEADLATYAQADGDDILFTSGDGTTKLDHEIELYTSATGRLTAWVEIPTLYAEQDTTIYMYYGNSGASSQQNATGVWDSNYKGVYHLNESAVNYIDSTSNANHGTTTSGTVTQVGAKIYNGQNFAATSYIRIPNFITAYPVTVEYWASTTVTTNNPQFNIVNTGINVAGGFGGSGAFYYTGVNNKGAATSGFVNGNWNHVVVVQTSSSDVTVYTNGVNNSTNTNSLWGTGATSAIGARTNGGFTGRLDEFRVSDATRSAGWIATSYNNQSATSTFYSISGAQTSEPSDIKIRGGGSTNSNVKIRGGLGWYSSSWLYRKPITINKSKVPNSDQTNFPVLVDLTDSGLQASAQADGDDILFTSGDGTTKLDHEIELYTSATGRLTAWVEIPTLYAEQATTIYMYYGNSGASSQQNATGVWDSNYLNVHHLGEGDSTTSGFYKDSTANNRDFTLTDADGDSTDAAGKIGQAFDFNGADAADYMSYPDDNAYDSLAQLTTSAWIKWDTDLGTAIITNKGELAFKFRINATDQLNAYFNATGEDGSTILTSGGTTWYYVTGVYNGSNIEVFVNGVSDSAPTAKTGNLGDNSNDIRFGIQYGDVHPFDGIIDEVRISNIARSASWILTEYNNQSATSTFYTIGTEETNGNASTRGGVKFR